MRFVGGAGPSAPTGEQKLPGTTSYLIGDEADWVRGVPNYASVRYASVYPGIDAVFHGNREHLEYDFVLRPVPILPRSGSPLKVRTGSSSMHREISN